MSTSLRLSGLLLLALLAGWLILRGCTREPQPVAPAEPPTREAFHPSRALLLDFAPTSDLAAADRDWLTLELRTLLIAGKMRLAPVGESAPSSDGDAAAAPFVLRLAWTGPGAKLTLLAPDGVIERELAFQAERTSRLKMIRALAAQLPAFLEAPDAAQDWSALVGFTEERAYDAFTRAAGELLGRDSPGFTRATRAAPVRTVERLEALSRQQHAAPRSHALLALGYLSLGGEDAASLTALAESSAERALASDPTAPHAHAALGLAALRRGEWLAAHERFNAALEVDPNETAALEGLACLLVDAGRYLDAHPLAQRATTLQPRNVGANECLAYAAGATLTPDLTKTSAAAAPATAQVMALQAMLSGDAAAAERWQRAAAPGAEFDAWGLPVLRAVNSKRHVAAALRAVTSAASDRDIDAFTEVLCGAALRQPEFVFNRMARLQRDGEAAPLRLLWLPQTQFLRQHARFESTVSAAGLPAFWQEQGPPDLCVQEPHLYGCPKGGSKR